ncbi:phosphate regulon transcriptional regulator PhoB [soil metagenome]
MAKAAPLLVLSERHAPPRRGPRDLDRVRASEDDDPATVLARLGAEVRTISLFGDAEQVLGDDEIPRVIVVDGGERPDLAVMALRDLRRAPRLAEVPALVVLAPAQIARLEPSSGFDDFIVAPCTPVELYARVRQLEWRRSEFSTEERTKIGDIVIDRVGHEVTILGRRVSLTAREYALLAFLAQHRGKVFRREALLARVWGTRYDGGARTVDIHVRRLRMKIGEGLPLETLRGEGYVLRAPTIPGTRPARRP